MAPKGTFLCLILVLFKEKYLTILSWRNQMRTCKDYRHRCACVARDPSAPVEMPPDGPSTRLLAYPLVSCVSLSDWSCVFEAKGAKVVWSSAACYSVFCFNSFYFFRFLVKLFHNKNETKSKFLFLIPRRGRRRYGLECSVLVQQLVVVEIANIYPTSRIPCSARRCLPPLEPWGSGLRSARPRQCWRRRARGLPH